MNTLGLAISPLLNQEIGSPHTASPVARCGPKGVPTKGAGEPTLNGYSPQTWPEVPRHSVAASTRGHDPPPRPGHPRRGGKAGLVTTGLLTSSSAARWARAASSAAPTPAGGWPRMPNPAIRRRGAGSPEPARPGAGPDRYSPARGGQGRYRPRGPQLRGWR